MLRSRVAFGLVIGFAVSSFAVAQEPPRPGRGGFGRIFGPSGGPGGNLVTLLQIPEVRKELATSESQGKAIQAAQDKLGEDTRAVFDEFPPGPPGELEPAERERQFVAVRTKMDQAVKDAEKKLDQVLKPEQLARLKQLRLQRQGVEVFSQPEIAEKLQLTDAQKSKLHEIEDRGFDGFGPPQPNPKAKTDAIALLTSEQKTTWAALTGGEFKFPASSDGPFGFGPGGSGPGGFGGPMMQERKVVKDFDKDKDSRLNNDERKAARAELAKQPRRGGGPGGRGGTFIASGGPAGRPDRGGPEGRPGGGNPRGGGPERQPRGGGPGGFGPPGGRSEPGKPGPKVSPSEVAAVVDVPLYDPNIVRTLFLDFENTDWETELSEFHGTDVEVPATLTVDGKQYPGVGIHFRGMSSYGMVGAGSKRSLNVSIDFTDPKQRLYGYKTLNLLNSHEDSSFLHTVLYSHIARQYLPAPKANFVRVVINGESWGLYVNAQQFDKIFVDENFHDSNGTRWKVRGSPGGGGGLDYVGDKIDDYKRRYQIKSGGNSSDKTSSDKTSSDKTSSDKTSSDKTNAAWKALIELCRVMKETPLEKLEAALDPILDIDGALWFLAIDNALINSDGYWVRASDYCIYRDSKGKFHIIPHDMNESFQAPMGPGMGRGPGGPPVARDGGPGGPRNGGPGGPREGGPDSPAARPSGGSPGGNPFNLDPLIGMSDERKPLRSKLLAVPKLRERYLEHVRAIATDWLDWNRLGPLVAQQTALIEPELARDTRKLSSLAAFQQAVAATAPAAQPTGRPQRSLKSFAEERRKYLLDYPAGK